MPTTAVPAAQDALRQALAQALTPVAVLVELGTPHPDTVTGAATRVWLPLADPGASHTQQYTLSGLTAKSETWEQDVVVFTQTLGDDAALARSKLDDVLWPLLNAVAGDPHLGGAVELAEVTSIVRDEAHPERALRQVAAVITVKLTAWLTD